MQDPPPIPGCSDTKLLARLNEKLAKAKAAGDAGHWSIAIAVLKGATRLDPSRDIVWFTLGEAYREAQRYTEATIAYNKAIAIKPVGASYNNLGCVNAKLGNVHDAVQAYRNAVQVDPANRAQYCCNIGAVEMRAGHLDDANAAYDEAIRANSQFALPYYLKGENLLSEAEIPHGKAVVPYEACALFRRYLDLEPSGEHAEASRRHIDYFASMLASATCWKQGVPLPYQATFNAQQFARLKRGFIPQGMDNKWFVYYEEPHLFLHRSWTGQAVYRLALKNVPTGAEVTEALLSIVVADALGVEASGIDWDYEVQMLDYLVSSFLLGQDKPFPPMRPPRPLPMDGVVLGTCYAQSVAKPKKNWWRIW